jgi:hypothetical protein
MPIAPRGFNTRARSSRFPDLLGNILVVLIHDYIQEFLTSLYSARDILIPTKCKEDS